MHVVVVSVNGMQYKSPQWQFLKLNLDITRLEEQGEIDKQKLFGQLNR